MLASLCLLATVALGLAVDDEIMVVTDVSKGIPKLHLEKRVEVFFPDKRCHVNITAASFNCHPEGEHIVPPVAINVQAFNNHSFPVVTISDAMDLVVVERPRLGPEQHFACPGSARVDVYVACNPLPA